MLARSVSSVVQIVIQCVPLVAGTALLVTLALRGMLGHYTLLSTYVAANVAAGLCLLPLDSSSDPFFWIYVCCEPAIWVLQYAVVMDLFATGFRPYVGIRRAVKTVQLVALFCAIALSILGSLGTHQTVIEHFQAVHRSVVGGGFVFIVILLAFLFFLPVSLSPNAVRYILGCSVLFGVDAALLALYELKPQFLLQFAAISMLTTSTVYVWWLLTLTEHVTAGDAAKVRLRVLGSEHQQATLQTQMVALDGLLRRVQRIR
jgi:hypothetical protein